MMRTRFKAERRLFLFCVSLAALIMIASALVAVRGTTARVNPPVFEGKVSILDRPPASADRLPPGLTDRNGSAVGGWLVSPASARLAFADEHERVWVAPGRSDSVCSIVAHTLASLGPGQARSGGCSPRSALKTGTIFEVWQETADDAPTIVGVVDDAVSKVAVGGRTIPVENNVFVVRGVTGKSATLELQTQRGSRSFVIDPLGVSKDQLLGKASSG